MAVLSLGEGGLRRIAEMRDAVDAARPECEEEWQKLALAGKKIHAIKAYRDLTGKLLRECKRDVEAYTEREELIRYSGAHTPSNAELCELWMRYLYAGKKVNAIKEYRERSTAYLSLREAKKAVEEYIRAHPDALVQTGQTFRQYYTNTFNSNEV